MGQLRDPDLIDAASASASATPALEDLIQNGPADAMVAALERLTALPEFGMDDRLAELAGSLERLKELEKAVAGEEEFLRVKAARLLAAVRSFWTDEEIREATERQPWGHESGGREGGGHADLA